jgi:hypothetical protein
MYVHALFYGCCQNQSIIGIEVITKEINETITANKYYILRAPLKLYLLSKVEQVSQFNYLLHRIKLNNM